MRTIAVLVLKDARRRLAAPAAILISLAIPLALAGTMALAFGRLGGGSPPPPKLDLVIVDLDGGPLSDFLTGAGSNPRAAEYMTTTIAKSPEEGLALMRDENRHAMLVIPEGFTNDVLEGRPVALKLVKNPSARIMPIIAQQGLEVVGLYGSVAAHFLPEGGAERVRGLLDGKGWDDAAGVAALLADVYTRVTRSEDILFPPIIKVDEVDETAQESKEGTHSFDFLSWMYPGLIVMALLFVSLNQMKDLLSEQEAGTLRRQLAGPVTASRVLIAKVLSTAVAVAVSLALLLGIGSLFFGMHWSHPVPLAVASIALVFAATGFGALVYSIARTQGQGDTIGTIVVMLMSLIGGAFIPPSVLPGGLEIVSRLTFNYWGNETLRALAAGGSWPELGAHLPALAAMAVVFTLAGTFLLKQRHLRGAL